MQKVQIQNYLQTFIYCIHLKVKNTGASRMDSQILMKRIEPKLITFKSLCFVNLKTYSQFNEM